MGNFVTVSDIARQLGISHSTVSRALKDNPRISKSTTEKVKKLADQLGYRTNASSHHLLKGKSQLIGVIVPDISLHFFAKVVDQIEQILNEAGYVVLLLNTQESEQKEKKAIEKCLNYRVDGVIAALSIQTKKFDHYEKLLKYDIPLVFYDRVANFLPVPKVILNDYQGSYDATKHLCEVGCKTIAHISGSINLNNSNNRLYGYIDALNDHKIKLDEKLIHYQEEDKESTKQFLNKIFKSHPSLDGLSVFNDYVANYSINILQELGKKIPDDIVVIGFSDEPVATYMEPQLSSTQQVGPKMGKLASQKLLSLIRGDETMQNEKIIIKPEIVVRASTKRKQN
ncbi:LacI family transcriptional regulator [Reichenbachiella carrageenanivorans]|uniref:LacI family transcriptional regulator n=1 Tax=Reichenbachiella carrageenanivorans TaxID=2979869 RepID=A0ABY6D7P3_9BACT|nr:LacI family DNA-binding transcriptional regulator [Reichenbachiella carrageenanivorans]UXX79865.1 LacI family transcriptional regulator [Reichenbachiella carrageenanivorans]